MITRVFAVGEDKTTLQKAQGLGQFLSKKKGRIQIDQFSRRYKSSFQALNQNDLKSLIFLGSSTGKRFGEFTATEFATELAKEIWPPVDRVLVQDLYFIDTEENLTQNAFAQIQELTNELERRNFSRITVHVLSYKQALKDKAGSVLRAVDYTYKPKESFESRVKRVDEAQQASRRASSKGKKFLNIGLFSDAASSGKSNSNGVTQKIPAELRRRGESLIGFLEEEIRLLEYKASASYFSCFVRYEINTKKQKLACLKDLFKVQTLEQLQVKAKDWSKDGRVMRHWRNTCARTWGQSRTKDLLDDIVNDPHKEVRRLSLSQSSSF